MRPMMPAVRRLCDHAEIVPRLQPPYKTLARDAMHQRRDVDMATVTVGPRHVH
jgi:hypothetical protein